MFSAGEDLGILSFKNYCLSRNMNISDISADLRKLQQLECSASQAELVHAIQNKYGEVQKQIRSLEFPGWKDLPKDNLAQMLTPDDLPDDFPLGVEARKVTGDGNCLYNAASVVLVGNESFSPFLRLLTATELYDNALFYVKHPKLIEAVSDCGLNEVSLFIQCLSKNGLESWDEKMDHVAAVQSEAIGGCRDGEWSCMFHLTALATILGRPVLSAFPNCNMNTRPLFHGYILPRQSMDGNTKSPAVILWSRDGSLDNRPGSWYQSNHFVPLFKIDSPPDFASSQTEDKKRKLDGTNGAEKQKEKRKRMKLTDYFRFPAQQSTSKAQQGTARYSDEAGPHRTEITPPGLAYVAPLASSQKETCKKALGRQAISSSSCSEEKTSKEKYEEKRQREFKQHWKDDYPWVEHDPVQDNMFCKVCKSHCMFCVFCCFFCAY